MNNKQKITEKQEKFIIDLYHLSGYTTTKIINECKFITNRGKIYYILNKYNIPLLRKKGMKHQLTGRTFGYLTVIKMAQTEKSKKSYAWRAICKCSNCGNDYVDVHPQALLRGQTTSCGCRRDQYLKNTGKNSSNYKGYEDISGKYWGKIEIGARRRGYSFNITIEYAWGLFINQNKKCALSGLPLKFEIANRNISQTTASLDRINSKLNYIEGNVQWVHKDVNIMKNVFDQDYFINLCELIADSN
jgi:hypothetical protein